MKPILSILLIFSAFLFVSAQEQQQKVVHFKKLQSFLPTTTLPGYMRGKPTGSTQKNMGFSSSEASVRYEKATDSTTYSIEIKIVDMSLIPYAAWAMAYQQMDFENETEDGYEKSVTVAKKYKGIEKANTGDYESCSLNFAVGNRFHVEMEASGLDDVKILYSLVDAMDLDKLAKLTAE
ncbi:MAG: hypothetical protein AB1600_09405 [Bacteroidota bacterium]